MTKIYCYQIDADHLRIFEDELRRNNFELEAISSPAKIKNEIIFTGINDLRPDFDETNKVIACYNGENLSSEEKAHLEDLCAREIIHGHIDLTKNAILYRPLFNWLYNVKKDRDNILRLATLAQELNTVSEDAKREIMEIKKVHERLIPVRHAESQEISISAKYAAGESCGEFFDYFLKNDCCVFVVTSSPSYLLATNIITEIDTLKSSPLEAEDFRKFISTIFTSSKEMELQPKYGRRELDLALIVFDLRHNEIFGYNFGNASLIDESGVLNDVTKNLPNDISFIDESFFKIPLERGSKFAILSSGVYNNCEGTLNGQVYDTFVKKELGHSQKEILNEIFFQLKKDLHATFLKYDATVLTIEVANNALHII